MRKTGWSSLKTGGSGRAGMGNKDGAAFGGVKALVWPAFLVYDLLRHVLS